MGRDGCSSWTSISVTVNPSTMATIVVSSSQMNSWSFCNGCLTFTFIRWYAPTICKSGLLLTSSWYYSVSMLMTWCTLWTAGRRVYPSWRRGGLQWKIKGSGSTWKRPNFWYPKLMPYKNQANTPVLSAAMMLEKTPGLAAETQEGNGITDGLVADPNYVCLRYNGKARWRQTNDSSGCKCHTLWGGHFLLSIYMLCSGRGSDGAISARCCVA